jgi:molecular chaperone GrpE
MSEKDKENMEQPKAAEQTDINTEMNSDNSSKQQNESQESSQTEKPKKKRGISFSSKKEDELQEKVEDLTIKVAEINDKYLRLYSEFDNYRKRTIKEKAELYKTAAEDTIIAILPVVDDFERALKAVKDDAAENAHKAGIELIYNKLAGILKNKGVESIDESGVDFDLDLHEAITKIPAPMPELKNKVVEVVEKGYKLGGKVIRFAKVVIGE